MKISFFALALCGVCALQPATIVAAEVAPATTTAVAPALISTAQSSKIFYDTSEPISAEVAVRNASEQPRTVKVSAWLEAGLNRHTLPLLQMLALEPKSAGSVQFRWPAHALGLYGYALRCRIDDSGAAPAGNIAAGATAAAPTSTFANDYFTVCDNYWNVALSSTHPIGYTAGVTHKQIADRLASLRSEYYNGFEVFFWAPDDFAVMTPHEPVYYSGQVRYHESLANLQYEVQEAHRLGMRATTYGKCIGSGSAGAAFVRAHPEMVYRQDGRLSMQAKVQALAYWDRDTNWAGKPGPTWQETNWIFYNMNDAAVVDYGSDAIARSAALLGWDGVRFDGHYAARTSWQDDTGKVHSLSAAACDALTATNIQRMKARILSKRPGFYFGYNYLNGSAAAALVQSPLELRELSRGGGHIMNEYIGQAADINHPLHRWRDFAALMASDSAIVHSLGGHYFPILNYQGATLSYANALAYACGAHPYYRHLWGAFATRYAGALWDTALMPYRNPDALLQLPATVWWRDFVHQRDVGQNHRRVFVNLIVPPRSDFVTNDKAEELPAPLDNVRIGIRAGALGSGYKLATATLLDPDNVTQTVLPIHPTTAGTAGASASSTTVTVPQIRLWNVLALDFIKG